MKRILFLAVLTALTATPVISGSVVGTKHDMIFSGFATGGGNTEVCVFCHTPHGAQVSVTLAPLWNNTLALGVDATVYNSVSTNFPSDQAKINATDARLCLACHDSGVGMPVNLPNSGTLEISTTTLMSANALISTDMSNDHPIGMDLGANPNGTDPGIRTLAEIRGATVGFGSDPFYGGVLNDSVNIMWCSTCHNVHDNANAPFLRKNNAGSALCKACHIK